MHKKLRSTSIMSRYAMLLFMVIATLAAILSYILLNFAASMFWSS